MPSPIAVDEEFYASYLPSDLPYNEQLQNDLASILVNPEAQTDNGIRVIPPGSDEAPEDGVSIREKDIVLSDLPRIARDELPLQLSDPRRIYASHVPGVKLTHPHGYIEGGPGQDPELVAAFNRDYLSRNNNIHSAADLEAHKQHELEEQLNQAKENAEKRTKAIEHNANIRRQLAALEAQHQLELNLQKRMVTERKEKREAKEKKKGEKAGG